MCFYKKEKKTSFNDDDKPDENKSIISISKCCTYDQRKIVCYHHGNAWLSWWQPWYSKTWMMTMTKIYIFGLGYSITVRNHYKNEEARFHWCSSWRSWWWWSDDDDNGQGIQKDIKYVQTIEEEDQWSIVCQHYNNDENENMIMINKMAMINMDMRIIITTMMMETTMTKIGLFRLGYITIADPMLQRAIKVLARLLPNVLFPLLKKGFRQFV